MIADETVRTALKQAQESAESVEGLMTMVIQQMVEGDVEAAIESRKLLSGAIIRCLVGLRMARQVIGESVGE